MECHPGHRKRNEGYVLNEKKEKRKKKKRKKSKTHRIRMSRIDDGTTSQDRNVTRKEKEKEEEEEEEGEEKKEEEEEEEEEEEKTEEEDEEKKDRKTFHDSLTEEGFTIVDTKQGKGTFFLFLLRELSPPFFFSVLLCKRSLL